MTAKIFKNQLFIFIALLFAASSATAQLDSNAKSDSLNTNILDNYTKNLAQANKQRLQDSIRKAELDAEIRSLKTTDLIKKQELQDQLEALNSKEERRLAEKKLKIEALRSSAKSYPIRGFFNDTLFSIYSKLGSFSAQERAQAIENRIKKLTSFYDFKADAIQFMEAENSIELFFRETIIMSVSENDAIWNNTTKLELAKHYKSVIEKAVLNFKMETSFSTLAKEIGLAFLVLLITVAIIYYINKLYKWVAIQIRKQENRRIQGIKIGEYNLFDAERQVNALLSINTIIKWILILLLVYVALPILFGIFPWTKHFADTLFGYILNPAKRMALGFWNYLPDLFTIIVIFIIFKYVLKGLHFLKSEVEKGNLTIAGFYPDWANPTFQIVRVVWYAFMFVLIFPYLPGSDSPIFKGVSVFLGVLFTFGSSGSLSNIMAGLVLTYMRLFKIGDRVKIGEVVGDVVEKSMLVTRVRTTQNEMISIPNSTVMSSHTINYSSDCLVRGLILHTTVTIGYDVPWKTVHQALLAAADRTSLILKTPAPFVLQTNLEDFYVAYELNASTNDANGQGRIYSELHANIQDCFNEAGIEIMSPHYRAGRDGNRTTIPANYLDKDYQEPSFRMKNIKDSE